MKSIFNYNAKRARQLGLLTVAFFTAKGLLWLVAPLLLVTFGCRT